MPIQNGAVPRRFADNSVVSVCGIGPRKCLFGPLSPGTAFFGVSFLMGGRLLRNSRRPPYLTRALPKAIENATSQRIIIIVEVMAASGPDDLSLSKEERACAVVLIGAVETLDHGPQYAAGASMVPICDRHRAGDTRRDEGHRRDARRSDGEVSGGVGEGERDALTPSVKFSMLGSLRNVSGETPP
jgi:hypothetical protein